jgi:hypothetical protein
MSDSGLLLGWKAEWLGWAGAEQKWRERNGSAGSWTDAETKQENGSRAEKGFQAKRDRGGNWASKIGFEFWFRVLDSNQKVLNIFKWNLNWFQNRINSNKLFWGTFQIWNLKLGLNIQI